MASIVLGVATAHTPLLILPPEMWTDYAERDRSNRELVFPPEGLAMSFDDAVANCVPPEVRQKPRTLEQFEAQSKASQDALDLLAESLREAKPDVIVIISDDQDEWFYENNLPSFAVYWGESVPIIPRPEPTIGSAREIEMTKIVNSGYAARRFDVPVDAKFGRHLIEHLTENDFDVSQMTYVDDTYGGRVSRRYPSSDGGELDVTRDSPHRPVGLPHGYSFVVQRLLDQVDAPIVPIVQNTCYPPNAVTPRRCYDLGSALAEAVEAWTADLRVAVIASGGLSHFVVDKVIDRGKSVV